VYLDKKHDYDKAIVDYIDAIILNPKNSGYYDRRSNSSNVKEDLDGAIVDLNAALVFDPN